MTARPLHDNLVGRTLATPVIDARSAVRLRADVALTDRHLATRRACGIERLDLQPDATPAHDPTPPLSAAAMRAPGRSATRVAVAFAYVWS
ncbi:hypothetical protein [uncultured Thiocystis sp.]|jgi:hypothetical protein|uniref:hypothetical protein n=1 Tax=uncultured Thiocystis sp. TaxID=1202134 RepID=UPI0025D3018D|nr:hypothetical protein [uncultured Thiocystis sp.]